MKFKCPGQDNSGLKAQEIKCPECGYKLEIFSDEVKVRCPNCKSLVCRERIPSCIDWCRYAEKCIGEAKLKHGFNPAAVK